jgi:hypothetical protein
METLGSMVMHKTGKISVYYRDKFNFFFSFFLWELQSELTVLHLQSGLSTA